MSHTIVDKALDYSEAKATHGNNRFSRITPISGLVNGAVVLDPAVVSDVVFEVPATVLNFARSYLSFVVNFPAQGGGVASFINLNGCSPISRISVSTRTGVNIVDINNFQNFMLTTRMATTPLEEYIQSDVPGAAAAAITQTDGVAPTSLANLAPFMAQTSALNTAMQTRFHLPLSCIAHSLFTLDRNLYFGGEILTFRVSFGPTSRIGYGTGPIAFVVEPTIAAIPYLQLAVETNPDVRALVMDMCLKGYTFKVPYVYSYRYISGAAAAPYVCNIRLNAGHGQKLLRLYTANMHQVEAQDTAHTCLAITDYRFMLDQTWLQDYALTTASNDDWLYVRDEFKGSAIINDAQRRILANGIFSMLENFTKAKPHEKLDEVIDGVDLNQERQLTTHITTGAQSHLYQFVVCQRTMSIQNGLIQIV